MYTDTRLYDVLPEEQRMWHHQMRLLLRIQQLEEENAEMLALLKETRDHHRTHISLRVKIGRMLLDHTAGITKAHRARLASARRI